MVLECLSPPEQLMQDYQLLLHHCQPKCETAIPALTSAGMAGGQRQGNSFSGGGESI
jgi:hypothetical protein